MEPACAVVLHHLVVRRVLLDDLCSAPSGRRASRPPAQSAAAAGHRQSVRTQAMQWHSAVHISASTRRDAVSFAVSAELCLNGTDHLDPEGAEVSHDDRLRSCAAVLGALCSLAHALARQLLVRRKVSRPSRPA